MSAAAAWTLQGEDGLAIRVLARGATWTSCQVPLSPGGARREVLLGFADAADYPRQQSYIGATIGRFANRIAHGRLQWQGQTLTLARHAGAAHTLHGGPEGFDQRLWTLRAQGPRQLTLGLVSPAGDQGFPGRLEAEVSYRLTDAGTVEIHTLAEVDAPCPVALTNHAYFQLDGQASDVRQHRLQLAAASALPVDASLAPSGPPAPVQGTPLDYRQPRPIAQALDSAFVLDAACADAAQPAATLWAADGRLRLRVATSLPALQVYTGEHLGANTAACTAPLPAFAGVALEPQHLPDSPNHPEWPGLPSPWLLPGTSSRQLLRYRFDVPA